MGAAASTIAVGLVVLEDDRFRNFIPREPCINREFERQIYINSILYNCDLKFVDQIRMRPICLF